MTGISPPWQAGYELFRHFYPAGGLLLDLVAPPTSDFPRYVVKATVQMGTIPFLSVLGEGADLLGAETQACQKLFQVLNLKAPESPPSGLTAQPAPTLLQSTSLQSTPSASSKSDRPLSTPAQSSPVLPSSSSIATGTVASPLSHPPADRPHGVPQSPFQSSLQPSPQTPAQTPPKAKAPVQPPNQPPNQPPSPPQKSEPYRLTQPLGREEITAPEVDDWSEELAQIEAELKRLGWTSQQESTYLQERYGRLSRDHITDYGELLQFLTDLQGQSSPPRGIEPWSPSAIPSSQASHPFDKSEQQFSSTKQQLPDTKQQFSGTTWSREEMMEQVLAEIRRLGWTARDGSEYLQQTYHVKTRQELTDDQLQAFIFYLQNHP